MATRLFSKVFATYFLVILSAAAIVAVGNYLQFHRAFVPRLLANTEHQARDAVSMVVEALQKGHYDELQTALLLKNQGTPYFLTVVPFGEENWCPKLPTFELTADEIEKLQRNHTVGGGYDQARSGDSRGHFTAIPIPLDGAVPGAVVAFTRRLPPLSRSGPGGWMLRNILLALLPAGLVAWILTRHLVNPITRLETAARRMADGDLSTRVELKRSDELGGLSRAFDEMAASLERDITTRSRLLNDVSHELSTPVTTLRATIEALLDGVVPDQQRRSRLESMLRQVEHLSYLVDDITDLARFETGEISMRHELFEAAVPVQEAVVPAQALALAGQIELSTEVVEAAVRGDERRIMQVMKNLVANAIDHNPPGTRVVASCQREGDRVVFRVKDNGPPIPPRDREAIFERFYKVDRARSRKGAGLGLSIVGEILRAHGSKIRLEEGSGWKSFEFDLPLVEQP
ncbi:MAG: sensor histidine kinase [Vulcanimicrobiota bacterium]